nr:hypothetical protein CFP56_06441 [Quercus suber]
MAFVYFVNRPLRFLVCVGIGSFLGYRFPEGPIPYLEPFIKREERIYLSMADRESWSSWFGALWNWAFI